MTLVCVCKRGTNNEDISAGVKVSMAKVSARKRFLGKDFDE